MAERISRRLVLLSSAAIGAVYVAGYVGTQSADASLAGNVAVTNTAGTQTAAASSSQAVSASTSTITSTTTITIAAPAKKTAASPAATTVRKQPAGVEAASPKPTATTRPTATPAPPATATPVATGLRDGTYTGTGSSRRGGIRVALTVKGGRITNVAITGSSTEYPVSWISALPPEVVANQSAQIDLVSGATYSSIAFQGAVQQALAQA